MKASAAWVEVVASRRASTGYAVRTAASHSGRAAWWQKSRKRAAGSSPVRRPELRARCSSRTRVRAAMPTRRAVVVVARSAVSARRSSPGPPASQAPDDRTRWTAWRVNGWTMRPSPSASGRSVPSPAESARTSSAVRAQTGTGRRRARSAGAWSSARARSASSLPNPAAASARVSAQTRKCAARQGARSPAARSGDGAGTLREAGRRSPTERAHAHQPARRTGMPVSASSGSVSVMVTATPEVLVPARGIPSFRMAAARRAVASPGSRQSGAGPSALWSAGTAWQRDVGDSPRCRNPGLPRAWSTRTRHRPPDGGPGARWPRYRARRYGRLATPSSPLNGGLVMSDQPLGNGTQHELPFRGRRSAFVGPGRDGRPRCESFGRPSSASGVRGCRCQIRSCV